MIVVLSIFFGSSSYITLFLRGFFISMRAPMGRKSFSAQEPRIKSLESMQKNR